ncbi:MAG: hypothetical protein ABIR54_07145 [Burkholderiaceae bacterium]
MSAGRTTAGAATVPPIPFKRRQAGLASVIRIAGPVTLETMRGLYRETHRLHSAQEGARLLLDFRAATILLDVDEWEGFSRDWLRSRKSDLAIGLLVGLEASEAVRNLAWEGTVRGQITLAFLTPTSAYRWLALPELT